MCEADNQEVTAFYDAGKWVEGGKCRAAGRNPRLGASTRVVPASVQDHDAVASIGPCLAKSALLKVWADLALTGEPAAAPRIRHGIDIRLVGRKNKTGFAVEPKRWRVEVPAYQLIPASSPSARSSSSCAV